MPSTSSPRPAFYRPELDGLRFFAFLFVFVTHAFSDDATFYTARGTSWSLAHLLSYSVHVGRYGVPLFFVLSSYLITELLLREQAYRGSIDVPRFYVRRALRIWPLYIAFVVASYVMLRALAPGTAVFPTRYLLGLLLFVGNWSMWLGWGPSPGDMVTGALWSVSIEEQFYLVWPMLLRIAGAARVTALAWTMVAAAVIARAAMDVAHADVLTFWYSTFSWLDSIGAGALLAVALHGRAPAFRGATRVALFVAGPLVWSVAAIVDSRLALGSVFYPLVVCGSVLVFLSAVGSRGCAHPVLVYLGKISYGLYVLHLAGLLVASAVLPPLTIGHALLALAITIALASISYRLLEAPFLRLKKRFSYVESRPVSLTSRAPETLPQRASA